MKGLKDMKPENRLLLIAMAAGLAAGIGAYLFLWGKEKELEEAVKPVKVITAAKYIPALSTIDKESVQYGEVPAKFFTKAHATEFNDVKGRVALVPFLEGEAILVNKVAEKEGELNTAIPAGMRAVSVSVNEESGVGYMVRPGDYVDVLLTYDSAGGKGAYNTTATILQAVRVIAAGMDSSGAVREEGYQTLTLALTPEEAEIVVFSREKGRLSFSLRPVGDRVKEKIRPMAFTDVVRQSRETQSEKPVAVENELEKREE